MTSHELKCALADYGRATLIVGSLIAYTAGGMAFSVKRAAGHEAPATVAMPLGWSYPLACCSDKDCAPIREGAVTAGPDGYRVTLRPGDHPFITAPASYLVSYRQAKDSPDGIYHICLNPSGGLLCFFAPPRGF